MKVIINRCFGGWGLSARATMLYAQRKGFELYAVRELTHRDWRNNIEATYEVYDPFVEEEDEFYCAFTTKPLNPDGTMQKGSYYYLERDSRDIRTDPILIKIVEELDSFANGHFAELKVVDIPDGIDWVIDEYDGLEHIEEAHESWY